MTETNLPLFPDPLQASQYPDVPGFRADDCSRAAAAVAERSASRVRDSVLAELQRCPGTADEIADRLGLSILTVRPRFSELKKMGRVIKTGERRKNRSGCPANVWRVV
jgi:predicted ArsR family transcriptional regulator